MRPCRRRGGVMTSTVPSSRADTASSASTAAATCSSAVLPVPHDEHDPVRAGGHRRGVGHGQQGGHVDDHELVPLC